MSSRLLVGLFFGAALWSAQTLRANDELQNAREAWRSIEEAGTTGTVVTKSESPNNEGVRTSTVYRNKDLFAVITEVPNGEGPSEVVLRNDRGVYGLRRAAGEEQWQLGIAEELKSERSKLVFRVGPASAQLVDAIRLHGTTLYRMAHSDYATFSNWEQFLDDRGNQLIRFHVSVDRDDLEKRIATGEYDFVVDPAHRFRVVTTRAEFPGGVT